MRLGKGVISFRRNAQTVISRSIGLPATADMQKRPLKGVQVDRPGKENVSVVGLTGSGPITAIENEDVEDSGKLLVAISDLDGEFGIKLDSFPNMVVVGLQSGGKTSLIEGICGQNVLPKKNDLATKKPFNITTIRSEYVKFKVRDQETRSATEAADWIDRLNENPSITSVDVVIYGPELHNARFTDLPGLRYVFDKSNKDFPKKIQAMIEEYLKQPNNIPIVVSAANSDPATNQAIQMVSDFGRENDAIGVLTKADLTKKQDTRIVQDMLGGKRDDFRLGRGWFATVLRNQAEIDKGMTVKEKEQLEKEFFAKHPEFSPSGISTIRRAISTVQFQAIKANIPKIITGVNVRLEDLKHSGSFLSKIMDDPKNKLAGRLQAMIEKLVGSSLERAEFEESLRTAFRTSINGYMKQAISPKEKYVPEYSTSKTVDSSIMKYHSNNVIKPAEFADDTFRDLFMYGLVSPIVADNDAIQTAYRKESALATSIPMIHFFKDDPLGKKRLQWSKFLNRFFGALLIDNNIQKLVYEITEARLLEYIKADSEDTDGLSHKFAEYIVREIGSKTYNEIIQFSITSMINIEKRPDISLIEVSRELAQMYPEAFTFTGDTFETFFRKNNKLSVEVYGEEFNEAYLRAVSSSLADKIYRTTAVCLLDKMVTALLEMTFDMFSKENVEKETTRVKEKIEKLENIRGILTKFT